MSDLPEVSSGFSDDAKPLMHVVVKVKDEDGKLHRETGEVISASQTGAGFYITRECKPGRIVSMMIPLEKEMRAYDLEKELYRVWGLVQHCHQLKLDVPGYHVGVAFIGPEAPKSYRNDPMQSYRICGMYENGLWKIKETGKEFKPRKESRYYVEIEHYLALVNGQTASIKGERAKTENISKHGAAVITTLDVNVGDRVKLISEQYDFSGLAVVCNRRETSGNRCLLNLQFVESKFPVEKIKQEVPVPEGETVFA